jgi:hypothetical protein
MENGLHLEVNISSDRQEIRRLLLNTKVRYRIPNSPSIIPILSQMNPLHIVGHYFFKINFGRLLPSSSRFPKMFPPFGFSD